MMQTDLPSTPDISPDTAELALELSKEKVDRCSVMWLIEDRGADVGRAMILAHLKEQDLLKRPALRPLGLQKYLQGHYSQTAGSQGDS
jgi:hypothetical protein